MSEQATTETTPNAAPATDTPAAQPAAPQAAPAASPTPAPSATPASTEETPQTGAEEITYAPTGDASLDVALGYLAKNGLDAEHPAVVAATGGDFSLLKAHLAAAGATGWEAMVALGEQAYERHQGTVAEREKAVEAAVFDVVGGQEQWTAVSGWLTENADQSEKDAINKVLESGDTTLIKLVMGGIMGMYSGGAEYNPKSTVAAAAPAGAVHGNALTPEQYTAEVARLMREGGYNERVDADLRRRVVSR